MHPGGPFFRNRDNGSWTIPKGEFENDEDPLLAARRELREETGYEASGAFLELEPVIQKGGKRVLAWAVSGDLEVETIRSNSFTMEWPPKSGKQAEFPEIDKAEWFGLETARKKINPAQIAFLNELEGNIKVG